MKYFLAIIFAFLANIVFAQNPEQSKPVTAKYALNLIFDKTHQKIMAQFHNKSAIDLQMQRDFSPFSMDVTGIILYAYEDSEKLKSVTILYPIGHDPTLITIPAKGYVEEGIELDYIENYCDVLNKSSILIFWCYSYYGDDYTLLPTEGVLRIKKSDVECKK